MIFYFVFLIVLCLLSISERPIKNTDKSGFASLDAFFFIILIAIVFFIGLRHGVGADWGAYAGYYDRMAGRSFAEILTYKDPAYQVLNYVSYQLNGGVWLVNLVSSAIFVWGVSAFCAKQSNPYLALVCAYPYLLVIVGMGFTRQAVAIGLIMVALTQSNILRYSIICILAALFHKSAVLMIPLIFIISSKNKYITYLSGVLLVGFGYFTLLADSVDQLMYVYIEKEYQSSGALLRVVMCVIPAIIYLRYKGFFDFDEKNKKLWIYISWASLVCLVLLLVTNYSTAIDRVALYFIPLQIVVFSNMPKFLVYTVINRSLLKSFVILYHFLILFVWMFFANNAGAWLPYRFYFFHLLSIS